MTAARYDVAECRSCSALVIWTVTEAGKAMPVDSAPDREIGNVALHHAGDEIRAVVVPRLKAKAMRQAGQPLYLSHFGSCTHADRWRKDRK